MNWTGLLQELQQNPFLAEQHLQNDWSLKYKSKEPQTVFTAFVVILKSKSNVINLLYTCILDRGFTQSFHLLFDLHTFGLEDPANLSDFSEHSCYGYFLWSKNRRVHITGTDLTLFCIQLTSCMFCSFVMLYFNSRFRLCINGQSKNKNVPNSLSGPSINVQLK